MTVSHKHHVDPLESEEADGVAALAGAAVTGLVMAMGFVALMARVGGPAPVKASVATPAAAVVAPAQDVEPHGGKPPVVQNLYDESGTH